MRGRSTSLKKKIKYLLFSFVVILDIPLYYLLPGTSMISVVQSINIILTELQTISNMATKY